MAISCIDCKNRNFNTHKDKYVLCVIDFQYQDALRWRTCPHGAFGRLSEHLAEMDRFELNSGTGVLKEKSRKR